MQFIVNYIDSKGGQASLKIEATTKEEARWNSKIPERRIVSVSEDFAGKLAFLLEPPRPDVKNQAVFMQTLSSSLSSGRTVHQGVESLLTSNGWIKYKNESLTECEGLSDYLKLFRFERFAILMARAAEKTGALSAALREVSRYLLTQERIRAEVSGELRLGIIYIILGLAFFTIIPTFIGPTLLEMSTGNHPSIKPNYFTLALITAGELIRGYGYFVLIGVAVSISQYKFLWQYIRKAPFFNLFYKKQLLDRGTQFLSVYRMLRASGFVDSEIIYELLNSTTGETREVYGRIYAHLATSKDIQDAFEPDDWDPVVIDSMSIINEVDDEEQQHIMSALEDTMQLQNLHAARSISKALSRIGFILMLSSVVAAVVGFYLPLAGGASNGLH
ncbi:hypothetical protein A9Q99_13840 [Gammaproteobacteria bacterium 45_16_T64]|nr:hypothetical protein A9Q99_13840 [Gammaproteobacteria bacterium 45_16_T64]